VKAIPAARARVSAGSGHGAEVADAEGTPRWKARDSSTRAVLSCPAAARSTTGTAIADPRVGLPFKPGRTGRPLARQGPSAAQRLG